MNGRKIPDEERRRLFAIGALIAFFVFTVVVAVHAFGKGGKP